MPTYNLKLYARVSRGSTVGELLKKYEITAPGLSEAERIAVRDHREEIDFETDFAILEGETGFVSCWLTRFPPNLKNHEPQTREVRRPRDSLISSRVTASVPRISDLARPRANRH
jgi:hypothetical protein